MKIKIIALFIISLFIFSACQPIETETLSATPSETLTTEPTLRPTEDLGSPTEEKPTPASLGEASPTPSEFTPTVTLEPVANQLTAPVDLDEPADGSGRLFITDQIGLIHVIDSQGNRLESPLLDLRDRMVAIDSNYDERGLLGLAIHPDFSNNGRIFVYYSAPLRAEAPVGWNHTSVVSEFIVSPSSGNTVDPTSEKIILQVDQPQSNHNAGAIAFGPDGYLYVPLGDGGSANDVGVGHSDDWYETNAGGNAQNVEENMLGSVLRIDIDNGDPYSIPEDNPGVSETYPEIWAYGFRNPYRMAFDPEGEQDLFLGDAGQRLWEEVSIVEAGGNYGWNVREGTHCFSTSEPGNPTAITECPREDPLGNPLIDPIIEFRNSSHPDGGLGTSIIGGVVYRGDRLSAWNGRYVFGQWSTSFRLPQGGIFVAEPTAEGLWHFEAVEIINRDGGELGEFVLAFGQDQHGEIYLLTSMSTGPSGNTGSVYRILAP